MPRGGRVVYRTLREGDVEALVAGLRAADLAEVYASTDLDPVGAVVASLRASATAWVVEIDGRLAAVFGVATLSESPRVGAPWLLGTTWLDENRKVLVREPSWHIEQMLCSYQHLLNYVDARNVKSVRWLRRLGFKINPPEPYGPRGFPFHKFEMERR